MKKLKAFIESNIFQNFILVVIILNCVSMGLATSTVINERFGNELVLFDRICLAIFCVELVLKIIVYNKDFLKNGWNIFDTVIVLISLLSDFPALSSMRALRILRVFRSLRALKSIRGFRLVSSIKHLQVIILAIINSIPSILWTGALLLLIYYIFALMGVMLFGAAFPEWFGTLGAAMYTLFQVMTLESWSMGISRPVMEVFPAAWAYFVPFVLVSSFVIMNVVVGIVVNAISEIDEKKIDEDGGKKEEKEPDREEMIRQELALIKEHLGILEELAQKKSAE